MNWEGIDITGFKGIVWQRYLLVFSFILDSEWKVDPSIYLSIHSTIHFVGKKQPFLYSNNHIVYKDFLCKCRVNRTGTYRNIYLMKSKYLFIFNFVFFLFLSYFVDEGICDMVSCHTIKTCKNYLCDNFSRGIIDTISSAASGGIIDFWNCFSTV